MNFLIIAGHISYDARKYEHLIDLYDKNLISNVILPIMNDRDKIDIVCSPNCFNSTANDDRLSYKMITENESLACEWIKKNISKYDFIIALSDVFGHLKDDATIKTKPCIVFNTLAIDGGITWNDFESLNLHSVNMMGAACSISRFIEEPLRYYICHKDKSQFETYGYESLKSYFVKLISKHQYKIDIAKIKAMPTLKQTLDYNAIYNGVKALNINWLDIDKLSILLHDRSLNRYLISFAKDNTTFAMISQREQGTDSGHVEVSNSIPFSYFKMAHMLKLRLTFNICIFFPALHNFLNTVYVIPNYPNGVMTSRSDLRDILDEVFFSRDVEFMKSFIVYEEGRGYYIVAKSTEDLISCLGDQKLITHNQRPIFYRYDNTAAEEIQKNLSTKFWQTFNSKTNIKRDDRVLDMEAISDIVLDNINSKQIYQHNKFSGFNEQIYLGKINPNIKYDHIIFAGTYHMMALSHDEVERYWDWLYLMLEKQGKVYIIGQDLVEPKGESKTQIIVGQSALGTYQIMYNELASCNAKRYALFNQKILTYFNPLDTISMNVITKQFNYKKIPYSPKSEIYIHVFTKKADDKDGEATSS